MFCTSLDIKHKQFFINDVWLFSQVELFAVQTVFFTNSATVKLPISVEVTLVKI